MINGNKLVVVMPAYNAALTLERGAILCIVRVVSHPSPEKL